MAPTETLVRLTTRFERGGSRANGSGLGLTIARSIARSIAAAIGAEIALTSPRSHSTRGF